MFLVSSGVCVEVVVVRGSDVTVCVVAAVVVDCVWVVVVFMLQPEMIRSVLFPDAFVFVKVIPGKFDFLLVSVFLVDSTSLASRTGVDVCLKCSCCGDFCTSGYPFFPLLRGFLCHLASERLSSLSDEPCQFSREAIRPLESDDFSSVVMNPHLNSLVSLRLIAAL